MNGTRTLELPLPESTVKLFLAKVTVDGANCWNWTGASVWNGYGLAKVQGKNILAHRLSYMHFKGAIPDDLYLDHLCRNRACINPEHLEAVTHRENVLRGNGWAGINSRKTHCVHGHEYTAVNTGMSRGARFCRTCKRAKDKARYYR